jgi:hypothetical protein
MSYSQNKQMKKQGLHNPALITAVASTPKGQKAISDALDNANKGVSASASILKGVLKIGLFLGIGFYVYKKVNGFSALKENKNDYPSSISLGLARVKAEAIYKAMYGMGNGFKEVKKELMGVNANGFVRIHNAFGVRKGINPLSKKMTLLEWFTDQFNPSELMELRFLIPNFF